MKDVSLKKNVILNVIKQVLSIAFPLITFPYVSRILLEDNYGKYSFGLSIANYVTILAALGIQSYAVREGARIRDNPPALNRLSCELYTVNLITTLLSYGALGVALLLWDKLRDYQILILVQCSSVIFTTLGANWVNSIFEDYEYMTKRYIFVKIVSLILIFAFVREREDYILYAAIIAASDILANLINIVYIRRYVRLRPVWNCRFFQHIRPILILFANILAVTIYANLAITLMGIFCTDAEVGIYSFSSKIYQIAKNLINAIIIVMIPRFSRYLGVGDMDAYNRLLKKTIRCIVAFMMPMIAGIIMLSQELILFLGGNNYLEGQLALKLMSLALIPASLGSIFFDGVLIANRKEKYCVISMLWGVGVNLSGNLLLIPRFGMTGSALAAIISELVSFGFAFWYSRGLCDRPLKLGKDYLSVAVGVAAVVLSCILVKGLQWGLLPTIAACVALSVAAYGVVLLVLRNSVCQMVLASVFKKR